MTHPNNTQVDELREKLAAIEHERWADWQKYMLDKCTHINDRGEIVFDSVSQVEAWRTQIKTPYGLLSVKERMSDMEQVDRYWPLIEKYLAHQKNTLLEQLEAEAEDFPLVAIDHLGDVEIEGSQKAIPAEVLKKHKELNNG